MTAKSKLLPRLHGPIVRWLDEEHFTVFVCGKTEILASKDYWEVQTNG